MSSLCDILRAGVPGFKLCTSIAKVAEGSEVFALTVSDREELIKIVTECVERIEGVRWYDDNPEYRLLCEKNELTHDKLFVPRATASRRQLRNVQLGDLGELLGCLTLAAHFGVDPETLFTRNLAKPSALKSESGYDVAVISIDLSDNGEVYLGPSDQFRAVESKASSTDAGHVLLSKAKRSFEQDIQEVQKLLQMYMHFATERFGHAPAVRRIPSFLFELVRKAAKFTFCCVATTSTPSDGGNLVTVAGALDSLHNAMAIFCTLDGAHVIQQVYKFRERAS